MWTGNDGMGHTHITADPERHEQLRTAIERHAASMAAAAKTNGESVVHGQALMLDALIDLLGRSQGDLGRPTITIIVDDDTMRGGPHDHTVCETDAGVDLPISVVERHLCDSIVQTVRFGADGLPLDVGRRYRTATAAQWVALKAMYRTCAWHRCDRPITWCQAHHIREWEHGGLTDLDNLVPLCSKHHHAVHEGGWRITLRDDRTLEIHRPPKQRRHRPSPAMPSEQSSLWASTRPDRRQHV